jgi:hypothetical protein
MLFVLAIALAYLYAWSRQTLGPGPGSALKVGFTVGFIAGFSLNFAQPHGPQSIAGFPGAG